MRPSRSLLPEDRLHELWLATRDSLPDGVAIWPDRGIHVRTLSRDDPPLAVRCPEPQVRRLVYHHARLGGDCRDSTLLLWRLMNAIRAAFDFADPVPLHPDAMREVLPNWLARASALGGLTILVEHAHEISRDGLTADLDWLPVFLPERVAIVLVTPPGPAAEQFRERAETVERAVPQAQTDAGASVRLSVVLEDVDEVALSGLWVARAGLSPDALAVLSGGSVPDLERFESLLIRSDDWLALHPDARDLVERRFLADHGRRQRLHERMAAMLEAEPGAESRLTACWHWLQAGRRDRLSLGLTDQRVLQAMDEQPAQLFDSLRLWPRLGDSGALVEVLRAAAERAGHSPASLTGLSRLYEALLGDPAPRVWAERALDHSLRSAEEKPAAQAFLRLAGHPDTGPTTAAELLERAVASARELDPQTIAGTLSVQAAWHEQRGENVAALGVYREALAAAEQAWGQGAKVLPWLANLGAVARATGDLQQADEIARRALRIARDELGPPHPALAACCDHVAAIAYMNNQYAVAEPLYREALSMTEAAFGADHPAVAACLGNLGSLLDARQQYREAEQCHRRAVAMLIAIHGERHADTAGALHNLGVALEAQGKAAEAEQLFRRALEAWNEVVGSDSPAFATTLLALACVLRDRQAWQESEALFRADIELWRKLMGPEHPHTLDALTELSRLYIDGGKSELAEPLLLHLCERIADVSGRSSAAWLDAVTLLAGLQHRSGRSDDARALLHSALAASENTLNMLSAPVQKVRRLLDAIDGKNESLH
ncbi:MAG: tetratricopeptide repeat protein [Wenzhouxiangellaceae bacterium]|nr:tetratricopeptide repeat protein [Wenzhouxiangellaceae bacterium]